jgi:hypothetical protein
MEISDLRNEIVPYLSLVDLYRYGYIQEILPSTSFNEQYELLKIVLKEEYGGDEQQKLIIILSQSILIEVLEMSPEYDFYYTNVKDVFFSRYKTDGNYRSYDSYDEDEQLNILRDFEENYDNDEAMLELWLEYIEWRR